MPTWSGTRAKLENEFLAPSLRGRLRYFAATYNKSHDREGRAAILLDGKEILKSNFFDSSRASGEVWARVCKEHPGMPWLERDELKWQQVMEEGYFDQWAFYSAFQEFSNQSIELFAPYLFRTPEGGGAHRTNRDRQPQVEGGTSCLI